MNDQSNLQERLHVAVATAKLAGAFLREHFLGHSELRVDEQSAHDIKLELDKMSQSLITRELQSAYPLDSVLGEEGDAAVKPADDEWIIDPIDGTVNFFYGIPIYCVSIALRHRGELVLGCVYDPMQDECYTALRGQGAYCNGRAITVSNRELMAEAVVFVGHGRHDGSGGAGVRVFAHLSAQVRKVRILGSAALTLCYIAAGRFDAYVEQTIYIWDFAAAQVILEEAGGRLHFSPSDATALSGAVIASNGKIPLEEALKLGSGGDC